MLVLSTKNLDLYQSGLSHTLLRGYFNKNMNTKSYLSVFCIVSFARDIVEVLYYLHCQLAESTGVVCLHRDIKASNILVSHTARALLVDFGVASIVPACKTYCLNETAGLII